MPLVTIFLSAGREIVIPGIWLGMSGYLKLNEFRMTTRTVERPRQAGGRGENAAKLPGMDSGSARASSYYLFISWLRDCETQELARCERVSQTKDFWTRTRTVQRDHVERRRLTDLPH